MKTLSHALRPWLPLLLASFFPALAGVGKEIFNGRVTLPGSGKVILNNGVGGAIIDAARIINQNGVMIIGGDEPQRQRPPDVEKATATLRWRNGESIGGQLLGGSAEAVTWKSPLFDDPLQLRWSALRRIDQALPATLPDEPWSIALKDGSNLSGRLTAITENAVVLQSARHGEVRLKRSEVLTIRRLKGGTLIYSGPVGDAGWELKKSVNEDGNNNNNLWANRNGSNGAPVSYQPSLKVGPGGSLSLDLWNQAAFLPLQLPDLVQVDFRLRSTSRPEFSLVLDEMGRSPTRLETWDNEIVLASGKEFQSVATLAETDRAVALHLCWNRTSETFSIWSAEGQRLAQWHSPAVGRGVRPGLLLKNKGRNLQLEDLRVRPWDGAAPQGFATDKPRVETLAGIALPGEIATATEEGVMLRLPESQPARTVPWEEIGLIVLSTEPPLVTPGEMVLSFADGTLLRGRFDTQGTLGVTLQTSFTEGPLATELDGLRQVLINLPAATLPPEKPLEEMDKLVVGQTELHGQFASAADASPRWQPIGGLNLVRPAQAMVTEISRALPAAAEVGSVPALFYTTGGDILPGKLRRLDREGVEIESPIAEITHLPASFLQAIQFGAPPPRGIKGFRDVSWRILKGDGKSVTREGEKLTLEPDTVIGNPSALQGSEIKFTIPARSFFSVRFRLFATGLEKANTTNLMLQSWGDRVIAGIESEEGQLESQAQSRVTTEAIAVRLVVQEHQLEFYLNGNLVEKFAIDGSRRTGTGLIIEPAGLWGNRTTAVTLTDFEAPAVPGRTWLPEIAAEAKTEALTVPRFRKDDPPRQALLAANGDLLRGEIAGLTGSHLEFRSGLESLQVPRDRVRAAIWLKQPAPDAPPPAAASPVQKRLTQRLQRRVHFGMAGISTAVAYLQQEASDLKFKLPEQDEERRFPLQFGGQTIGEILDLLALQSGLRYRIDSTGTILFETVATGKNLSSKVYWLKPGTAFPHSPSVQEVLVQKGVTFPAGATARLEAEGSQLVMTNTPANHGRVTKLLDAEFGGSLGSPTHWLILTNGARLGLAVDKFEKEWVVGHHPVFGKCRVPVGQIFTIRSTEPAATSAMHSLEDWQLVLAPEPVLPQGGGEKSPNVGKAAQAFKLPLLGGGEFELEKLRGQVVILDFWATWCGPCIKALPGVIAAAGKFPADRVKLVGVNQGEPSEVVQRFLDTRGWKLDVALDTAQTVGKIYGVEGIPHTVIIGPDGKIAWVKTGYSPENEKEAAAVIEKLLSTPPGAPDS